MWNSGVYFDQVRDLAASAPADGEIALELGDNTEYYLEGYKIWYSRWEDVENNPAGDGRHDPYNGTGADQGPSPVEIPASSLNDPFNPQMSLTGLPPGEYVVAVSATSKFGSESMFSFEERVTVSGPTPTPLPTASPVPTPSPAPMATRPPATGLLGGYGLTTLTSQGGS